MIASFGTMVAKTQKTIVANLSIFDVCGGFKYASDSSKCWTPLVAVIYTNTSATKM